MKKILLSLLFFLTAGAAVGMGAESAQPAMVESDPESDLTFDLHFEGGTFEQLLEAITKAAGERPNVVLGPGIEDIELPGFTLSSVTVFQVFQALGEMAGWTAGFDQLIVLPTDGISIVAMNEPAMRPSPPRRETSQRSVGTFQIGPFLESFQLQDLTTAIETAWELAGIAEGGRLRFHEETELLFVNGSVEHIDFVDQILVNLSKKIERDQAERQAREEMEARAEVTLYRVRKELEADEAWLDRVQKKTPEDYENLAGYVLVLRSALADVLAVGEHSGLGDPVLIPYLDSLDQNLRNARAIRFKTTREMDANEPE